jgi:hypothetical protein
MTTPENSRELSGLPSDFVEQIRQRFAKISDPKIDFKEYLELETQEFVKSDVKYDITSDGRMLVFPSVEDYEKVIGNPSKHFQEGFLSKIQTIKHATFAEKKAKQRDSSLIRDRHLSQILNQDGIVQIGDYLYRVNKPTESVYVLPALNLDEYQDLVYENKANKNIRKFSTGDPVIELAESGAAGKRGLFCREDGCGGKESITPLVDIPFQNSGYQFWGYNDYNRFGIYFSLAAWARASFPRTNSHPYRIYIQVENKWYKPRCESSVGPESFPWHQDGPSRDNRQKYQSYSSTKPLNGLHLKMRTRLEIDNHQQGGNPYTTLFTDWTRIQVNNPSFP